MIEEVYFNGELVVRFTNLKITSLQTAYREMLDHLTEKGGYRVPMNAKGKPDRSKVDFYVAQNLAALGMSKSDVRRALMFGSDKAQRQHVNGAYYALRTVEYAFRSLGIG